LNVFIGQRGLGEQVELREERLPLDIYVQAPLWMPVTTLRIYLGSRLLLSTPLGPPALVSSAGRRWQRKVVLAPPGPGPLIVAVEGPVGLEPILARRGVRPFAFTNPIWLVPEGQGAGPASPIAPLREEPDAGNAHEP
jgi:hypothetical protein